MVGGWNGTRILEKAELLKSLGEYSKCIRTIESVPEGERGYRMTLLLGWAYSDLAVLGDGDAGREDPDQDLLGKAVRILESVEYRGRDDPFWNARMCYALWMTDGRESDALGYAMRWKELDPGSEDARRQEITIRRYIDENVDQDPEMYNEAQWDAVEDHIGKHFGDFPNVFHELVSPDIHERVPRARVPGHPRRHLHHPSQEGPRLLHPGHHGYGRPRDGCPRRNR